MARTEMATLIALFRQYRKDITTAILDDDGVQNIFDQNRFWLDKVIMDRDRKDGLRFFSPYKYLEGGFTIFDSGDATLTPASTFAIEGIVVFSTKQDGNVFIQGFAHNFFYTLSLAMRGIIANDDTWNEITRGRVKLVRRDYGLQADAYERMGFLPRTKMLQRGG